MDSQDPRVHRFYRTVGSCFNNQKFFANVQTDDRVVNTVWDLEDEYMWKGMSTSQIKTLTTSTKVPKPPKSARFKGFFVSAIVRITSHPPALAPRIDTNHQ